MNKTKQIASALVLTMSMTMTMAVPALAADTTGASTNTNATIVGQVKPNTFSLKDLQTLAVQKNTSVQTVNVSLKLAENGRMMAGNALRDVENSLQAAANTSVDTSGIMQQMQELQQQIAATTDPTMKAVLEMQLAQLQSSAEAASSSMSSSYESLISARQSAESQVKSAENSEKDLENTKDELAIQMRYAMASLVISEQQLEKQIELLEKSCALAAKSQEIAKLQEQLGLSTQLDTTASNINAAETTAQLNQAKDSLTTLKRQINVMAGRPANAELNIAPVEVPTTITKAPTYNNDLVKAVTNKNYSLKTLQRDINNYHDQAEDLRDSGYTGSDKYQAIDYNIELKRIEMKDTETNVSNSLKSALDKINTTGETYRNKQQSYQKAQQYYEQTKMRYDLGMISQIEMQSAELTLLQAQTEEATAAYNHYLANEAYQALTKGVNVSSN